MSFVFHDQVIQRVSGEAKFIIRERYLNETCAPCIFHINFSKVFNVYALLHRCAVVSVSFEIDIIMIRFGEVPGKVGC